MQKIRNIFVIVITLFFTSCYYGRGEKTVMTSLDSIQADSMRFVATHHYGTNYNFIVKSDSIGLCSQLNDPTGLADIDTVQVYGDERIVVADIEIIPSDATDSIWVKVARDQNTMGWIHECELLRKVVPDDPISQFISVFSDIHLLIFLIIICVIATLYVIRMIVRRNARIVHFNDISTPYPTVLTVLVACSAALYASIQMFAPDTWQYFYYNPTLNPFAVPPILTVFLSLVWTMLVVGIATVDEVRKYLPFGEALLYLFGLLGICAVDYIIFSVTTLYYVGYVFLMAYVFFAFWTYYKKVEKSYICGNCGARLTHKGRCPECGAMNE